MKNKKKSYPDKQIIREIMYSIYERILREIVFSNLSAKELQRRTEIIRKGYGSDSKEMQLVNNRIKIAKKREMRAELKNYSIKVQFHMGPTPILSGFSTYEFDCTKDTRKKNFITPEPVIKKGYGRKNSTFSTYTKYYSRRYGFKGNEYAPTITSYVYHTEKRVIVFLENRVYKIRNAGRNFIFVQDDSEFLIMNIKNKKCRKITALDIIHNLPKIRKNLRKK